jgi:hypothetical protein
MVVSDLDSFYFKFKNLLHAEKDAILTVKSEAGRVHVSLSADLGHVLSAHPPRHHYPRSGPSQQRRRARRAEARAESAGKAVDTSEKDVKQAGVSSADENPSAVRAAEIETAEKAVEESRGREATENVALDLEIVDELCNDEDYSEKTKAKEFQKTYCSVEIYPDDTIFNMNNFRETVEDYFQNRTDAINEVIECKLRNYGQNVRLKVSVVNLKRGWEFFNHPRGNYGDLKGVKRVMHVCKNIGYCDQD